MQLISLIRPQKYVNGQYCLEQIHPENQSWNAGEMPSQHMSAIYQSRSAARHAKARREACCVDSARATKKLDKAIWHGREIVVFPLVFGYIGANPIDQWNKNDRNWPRLLDPDRAASLSYGSWLIAGQILAQRSQNKITAEKVKCCWWIARLGVGERQLHYFRWNIYWLGKAHFISAASKKGDQQAIQTAPLCHF